MASFLAKQIAIIGTPNGDLAVSKDAGIPELDDDMVLVQNVAVALNPVDSKMTGNLCTPGAIAGTDFAGTVLALGAKAQVSGRLPLAVGDRVCGAVHGMHSLTPLTGAFAEIVGAASWTVFKIPKHMSFEEGASFGSGLATIGLALFHSLKVPGYPDTSTSTGQRTGEKTHNILIYGGSSAVGTLAIQLAKLSGLHVVTTCSPANFALVKSFGADQVFDYRSPSCIADIKQYTRNTLKYVLDCISEPETFEFCCQCIGRTGGKYTALEPYPEFLHIRQTVIADWVLGPTVLGKPIAWPPPFQRPGDQEAKKFAEKWFATAQDLLDSGSLRPHPLRIQTGFESILDGLKLLKTKQISGQKLISRLSST